MLKVPVEIGIPPIIASGEMELFLKLIKTLPVIETSSVTNKFLIVALLPTLKLLLKLTSPPVKSLPLRLASPVFMNKLLLRNIRFPPLISRKPFIYICL